MVPCTSCTPTRNGRRPRRTALCPLDSLLFACCPRSLSFLPSNRDPASFFLPPPFSSFLSTSLLFLVYHGTAGPFFADHVAPCKLFPFTLHPSPFIYRSNILFSVKKLAFLIYQLKIKSLFGAITLHRCVFTLLFVNNFSPVY